MRLPWHEEKYLIGIEYFGSAFRILKILHMTISIYKYTSEVWSFKTIYKLCPMLHTKLHFEKKNSKIRNTFFQYIIVIRRFDYWKNKKLYLISYWKLHLQFLMYKIKFIKKYSSILLHNSMCIFVCKIRYNLLIFSTIETCSTQVYIQIVM